MKRNLREYHAAPEGATATNLPDPLTEAAKAHVAGIERLKAEIADLRFDLASVQTHVAVIESENASLKAQLDKEKAERRHYNSLANEIITRLDIVGKTVDDVVSKAHHEVARIKREMPNSEVPPINVPNFLLAINGSAEQQGEAA